MALIRRQPKGMPAQPAVKKVAVRHGFEPCFKVFSVLPVGRVSMLFIAHRVADYNQWCQCVSRFYGQASEEIYVQILC